MRIKERQIKLFSFNVQGVLFLVLLVMGTVLFRLTDLDLRVSSLFFFADHSPQWALNSSLFWDVVYTYGVVPVIVTLLLSIIVFFRSYLTSNGEVLRVKALCVIACVVFGPGVLVHGILKRYYPRPRPYQISRFQGEETFKKILVRGESGMSFPSGHASSGFVLTILFYVLFLRKKRLAWVFWVSAVSLGVLLGMARVVQGGHFASDIFWSFGLTQLVNILFYFVVFKIPAKEADFRKRSPSQPGQGKRRVINAITVILPLLFVLGFFFNRPIHHYQVANATIPSGVTELVLGGDITRERIVFFPNSGSTITLDYLVLAHGFPNVRFDMKTQSMLKGNRFYYRINISQTGFLREYRGRIKVYLPENLRIINEFNIPENMIDWRLFKKQE